MVIFILIITAESKYECNACFDGACYSKAPIFDKQRLSGQIAIDRNNNIVYFHYEDSQSLDYTAGFDLDDVRFKIIPDISFSFARAVDQNNGDVYMGGAHGIFKYSVLINRTVFYALSDKTIWHLQYKNKIYYTVFMKKGLFTYENNKSNSIQPLSNYTVDDFVISKNSDVYFMSDSKVYRLKHGESQVKVFADDMYALSLDNNDNVYFLQPASRGLYRLSSKSDKLIEIGAFDGGSPFKFVFDPNNNVVYYDKDTEKLYYLSPNFGRCRVTRKWDKHLKKSTVSNERNVKFNVQMIK